MSHRHTVGTGGADLYSFFALELLWRIDRGHRPIFPWPTLIAIGKVVSEGEVDGRRDERTKPNSSSWTRGRQGYLGWPNHPYVAVRPTELALIRQHRRHGHRSRHQS